MTEEAVVIEVVQPGGYVRSGGVVYLRPTGSSRSSVVRYVLQWAGGRVIRPASELVVDFL